MLGTMATMTLPAISGRLPICSAAWTAAPDEMPAGYVETDDRRRAIADYIAGMTDRFAIREHQRLTGRTAFP